ncbi:MAG: PA2169 family four-helix-bundle protein [Ramlibacter sp.]
MAAEERDMNRDPITDEPGAHPVGTGIGATGGAVAGATIGTIGGPIGAAIGGVVGAVVGGLAGKAAGEAVNPTAEEAYWRDNYVNESYYDKARTYEDYAPAYRLGLTGRTRYNEDWDIAEPKLASEWEAARAGSALSWPEAQPASRAAWNRIDRMRSTSGTSAVDNDDVIDTLDDLAECSKDGEYGFRACAEQAKSADLKAAFLRRADDCRGAAQELYTHIRDLGGKPDDGGTTGGALHRGWVAVKAKLSTYDDLAVLEEAERGEDSAVAQYRKALKQQLPANVKLIVERQAQGAQRNHDQIKALRDQFKSAS